MWPFCLYSFNWALSRFCLYLLIDLVMCVCLYIHVYMSSLTEDFLVLHAIENSFIVLNISSMDYAVTWFFFILFFFSNAMISAENQSLMFQFSKACTLYKFRPHFRSIEVAEDFIFQYACCWMTLSFESSPRPSTQHSLNHCSQSTVCLFSCGLSDLPA